MVAREEKMVNIELIGFLIIFAAIVIVIIKSG